MLNALTREDLREIVEEDIINPNIKKEIEKLVKHGKNWRITSIVCKTIGHVLVVISAALSFAGAVYNQIQALSFAAGTISVMSMALIIFSNFASNESKNCDIALNKFLDRCKIEHIPINNIVPNTPVNMY